MSDTTLTRSRQNSAVTHPYERRSNVGLRSDFGNLPFSSAIKANGYPENIQQQQLKNLDATAEYSMLPLHTFESEALGRAYLSFRDATLQMIADGMNARDVLGTSDLINLDLYFRDRIPEDGHSVSTFVCEMMKSLANPDVFAKLASMVLLAPLLRVRASESRCRGQMLTACSGYCFPLPNTTAGYLRSCDPYPARDLYHTVQL